MNDDRPRLHIDWTRCDARGVCLELLPELLDEDPWGYPVPRHGPDPVVPSGLDLSAHQAVRDCPRLALTLRSRKRS